MKRTIPLLAIATLLLGACGGMPDQDGKRSTSLIDIDQKPMPMPEGLFPTDLKSGVIASMGVAPTKASGSAVQEAHRFAALCNNGSMVISPRVDSATFNLSFNLGLISLENQRVLEFGSLRVEVIDNYLRLINDNAPVGRRKLWLPPTSTRLDISVQPYRVEFYIDGEKVGASRRDSDTFHAVRLRFGGSDEGDVVPGMCGGIDNLVLRDDRKGVINGRTAESTNTLLFSFDFDGNATNAGRSNHVFAFEGAAGLLPN